MTDLVYPTWPRGRRAADGDLISKFLIVSSFHRGRAWLRNDTAQPRGRGTSARHHHQKLNKTEQEHQKATGEQVGIVTSTGYHASSDSTWCCLSCFEAKKGSKGPLTTSVCRWVLDGGGKCMLPKGSSAKRSDLS